MSKALTISVILMLSLSVLCPFAYADPTPPLRIVATTGQLASLTARIGGTEAILTTLIDKDSDVHDFSLTPSLIAMLEKADLILISGAGLEAPFMTPLLRYRSKIVDTSKGIQLHKTGRDRSSTDPHYWLDLPSAIIQARNVHLALAQARPEASARFLGRTNSAIELLQALDQKAAVTLAPLIGRRIITYHESFGYMATRYGLLTHSLTGPMAEEPLPARLRAAYDYIKFEGIPAIFIEDQFPLAPMEHIARDTGVSLCKLDTLATAPSFEAFLEGYAHNASEVARCLLLAQKRTQ